MNRTVHILNTDRRLQAPDGANLLAFLQEQSLAPDAPCGGHGTCGKCRCLVNGEEGLACKTVIDRDLAVSLPGQTENRILTDSLEVRTAADGSHSYVLAFDIGTTTVVCYLLSGITGQVLAQASAVNPQSQFGADVIARIQYAMGAEGHPLRMCILEALAQLTEEAAAKAGISPEEITLASIVGNTAMHHLLLGIDPKPLTVPPYMPALREAQVLPAGGLLPIHPEGTVRILPNIAGFVGADTVGCMVSTRFDKVRELTLMIDIGTNGEMVLGDQNRRIACSTAAGPAFEGAKIQCGMRGAAGAVDHVAADGSFSVIGGGEAIGLCGSGLLDLVAVLLNREEISESGRMPCKTYRLPGTEVFLTQKDVREVQLAKAAIRAGIELMCRELGVAPEEIRTVLLAGAFGNYMDPASACTIGMIPGCLQDRIRPIGNAAGEGAKLCALSEAEFAYSRELARQTQFLELASLPDFNDCYVDCLLFGEEED